MYCRVARRDCKYRHPHGGCTYGPDDECLYHPQDDYLPIYDSIERHCPEFYEEDPTDLELAEYEATHYVWFDDEDRPHLGEGRAEGIINAIQLDEVRS